MNSLKLKGFRVSKGKTQQEVADAIEKTLDSYAKKERGEVFFTLYEAAVIAKYLEMTLSDFDDIFFDSMLPYGNKEEQKLQ